MPVFVAAIGGMLLNIVGTLVGRVLIAAGISVITYTGLSMTLDGLKANAIAAFHLAPLATPLSSILLGFPLAFAQELDARGVCKHMQAVAAWAVVHSHIQPSAARQCGAACGSRRIRFGLGRKNHPGCQRTATPIGSDGA